MKKMSFKCIFNWLYAKTLNRAMSDRQPREDRETISPVYRPVRVSYVSAFLSSMCSQWGLLALARRIYFSKDNSVCLSRCGWSASRISLVGFFLLVLGGWNSQIWGQKYVGTTWYSLYDDDSHVMDTRDDYETSGVFAPTAGTLNVKWTYKWWKWSFGALRKIDTQVLESSNDGSSTSNIGSFQENTGDGSKTTEKYTNLSADINWIKFNRDGAPTHTLTVTHIDIPMAKHIRLKSTSQVNNAHIYGVTDQTLDAFADTKWGTTASGTKTVRFRSFLTKGNIKITCDQPEIFRIGSADNTSGKTYSVGSNAFAYESGSGACSTGHAGATSTYNFKVYFHPAEPDKTYNATITITDGTSTATVHVSGKGIKRDQTIQNFPTTAVTHKTTDVVEAFAAYTTDNTNNAKNNLAIEYSSNNTDVATVNKTTGAVTIIKDGTVTFTAKQAGNSYYNSTSKSVKWTITKVTPTVTWPVIDDGLVYTPGAKVQDHWTVGSAVDDKGNAVAGTFACTEELQPAKNSTGYTVTFTPTNTNWYNSTSETIKKEVAKADQYIKWDNLLDGLNPRGKYYEYATGEAFDAKSYATANDALTGLTITYTSSNTDFATIVDGNKLNVVKSNEVVTITATCVDPAGNWNPAAVSVSKTFKTCGAKPDNWRNVTASDLTYGQLLSESELSGEVKLGEVVVPGTLEWVEASTIPNAGTRAYTVLFSPENEDAYGSVTFDVNVTVAKADPIITWNVGARLRENSRYSNFVISSNTEAALNISVSNPSLLSVEGNVLTTGAVTAATNGWIKVSQPETANYNAVSEQQLNVTINPKSAVCLPFTLNETIYNNAKEKSDGKVSWCSTNVDGFEDDYILKYDVTYTQRVGIALGSWDEGLTGLSFRKLLDLIRGEGHFSWSDKYVDLSFTGVPDKISFDVETQKVTSTWPEVTWGASATDWYLYESADGEHYTQIESRDGNGNFNRTLSATTRYVRIKYSGNFTGFVKDLQITQKKYLNVDKPTLTFGTEANPLQEPQTIKLSYASLGNCGDQNSKITIVSNNPAFYVDETEITENVDIDQMGEYTIRVRCNDVNQEGTLTIEANDGTSTTVNVRSTKPDLTTAHTETFIFQTGTEHAVSEGSAYRAQQTHNFTAYFNGGNPIFDTLYIYGVTESGAANRLWENDVTKGYKVPALNVAEGNVHTPCFVYAKKGVQYEYVRTFDASTESLDIDAAGKKIGFMGYKPVNETVSAPAIQLSGATEIYLNNAEIASKDAVMLLNGTNTIYARDNNTCSSSHAAAIQLGATDSKLTIEDSWAGDATSGRLALIPASGKPSIDLNGANSVIINGTQLELHNADKMAIVHMDGATEKSDGSVKINDGTITGESTLGMPQNTLIDGGTFNSGTIVCYNRKGKTVRPFNSRGDVLARAEKEKSELPDWYGKAHLTEVAGRVYPMLFGGEGLCIFEATQDHQSEKELNWSDKPESTSDAVIVADMTVNQDLSVNSLTINEGVTVTVENGVTLTIGDGDSFREQAGNLHVANGGKVQLTTGELIVNNFTLDAQLGINTNNASTSANSGQVLHENQLKVNGDAYFQLALDPSGRNTYGWYDFTVPFDVDVIGGISIAEDPSAVMKFNVNYAVMDYTEAKRAVKGKDWNKFQGTMKPGKVYTIALDDDYDWNTVVFKKKASAALTGDRTLVTEYSGLGAETKDNGWNGFGNGTLHHTELNVDGETRIIQVYDHANRCYQPREAKDFTIVVGMTFFTQLAQEDTVELVAAEGNTKFLAPSREGRNVDNFRLSLTADGNTYASDYLWVSADEEATGDYIIGRDVLKMGTMNESNVARIWSVRNGMNLCSNNLTLTDNNAICDLKLYAPKAMTYSLAIEKAPEDANLYLTYNGNVIWDLTASPYSLDLTKGTTEGYGLQLEVINAPQITTGVDEINGEKEGNRKVLINNAMYIITKEGAIFNATGKKVK